MSFNKDRGDNSEPVKTKGYIPLSLFKSANETVGYGIMSEPPLKSLPVAF